ncbi:hypothetical protein C7B62_24015 [Pleurocapsa sp. CCALA 161]|uniref:hypothetical protein n=1 Tax=Pleurocapsa sp. CCALA 161 TaxID=2107688 RepID=UPI000D0583B5|nr:hypothetical protein [Pleurocapsa sp. CCALA 161]PSB05976.1 hypothetical protein C7B62_24015 [Pleurocapsa sp. CCALA 161]
MRDEIKLRRSGELFYQGSINLLEQVKIALAVAQQQEINLADTSIDNSFSQFLFSLTQQSISTSFLTKYLIPQPKTAYQRESSIKTQVLSSTEAISLLKADLIESEVISLAHDEDINAWIDQVRRCLETNPQIDTMLQIVEATDLSIVQVFISLLFSDYELIQRNNFYGEIEIKN